MPHTRHDGRRRSWRPLAAALLLGALAPAPLAAQDSHWWTNQYGNRARLLGGAVIGSSRDLSAVYYNPGGLAVVEQPDALLTGYVFELDNIRYSDILFRGTDLSSTRFDAVAGLIAGELPFDFLGDSRLAYSYLTRHNLQYRFNEGTTLSGSEVPGLEDFETVAAALTFETRLREYWGGLSWSKPFFERYGIGVSLFVANRSQRMRYGANLTSAETAGPVSTVSNRQSYDYYDWRLLSKIGIATSFPRWNVGLTVTTPSLHLFGQGDVERDNVAVLEDVESVTTSFQYGLPSGYSTSWAIAAGGEYVGAGWKGHVAAEWFNRVDLTVLDTAPFRSQTDSTRVVDPDVTYVMQGLLNFAVGLERTFSESYSGYVTLYSDFTGSEVDDLAVTTTTPWNLWTVGVGAIFTVGRSEFTTGLTYKFGGQEQLADFDLIPDDERDNQLLSPGAKGRFRRLTLVLGFKLEFAPDL